jgi:hypothetical protein
MISANRVFSVILSSTRVSCAGESPAFANLDVAVDDALLVLFATPNQPFKPLAKKARFGVTPKPTRETRALPIRDRRR